MNDYTNNFITLEPELVQNTDKLNSSMNHFSHFHDLTINILYFLFLISELDAYIKCKIMFSKTISVHNSDLTKNGDYSLYTCNNIKWNNYTDISEI